MNYEKLYKDALKRAKYALTTDMDNSGHWAVNYIFPELKEEESDDERIRKELIEQIAYIIPNDDEVDNEGNALPSYQERINKYRAWVEKQKDYIKLPNSAYTSNKDVIEFANKYSHAVWEKLMDKFKKNENYSIGCNDVSDIVLNAIINTYNWLETQGEQKPIDYNEEFKQDVWQTPPSPKQEMI